jgi:hypothetical protein
MPQALDARCVVTLRSRLPKQMVSLGGIPILIPIAPVWPKPPSRHRNKSRHSPQDSPTEIGNPRVGGQSEPSATLYRSTMRQVIRAAVTNAVGFPSTAEADLSCPRSRRNRQVPPCRSTKLLPNRLRCKHHASTAEADGADESIGRTHPLPPYRSTKFALGTSQAQQVEGQQKPFLFQSRLAAILLCLSCRNTTTTFGKTASQSNATGQPKSTRGARCNWRTHKHCHYAKAWQFRS